MQPRAIYTAINQLDRNDAFDLGATLKCPLVGEYPFYLVWHSKRSESNMLQLLCKSHEQTNLEQVWQL